MKVEDGKVSSTDPTGRNYPYIVEYGDFGNKPEIVCVYLYLNFRGSFS